MSNIDNEWGGKNTFWTKGGVVVTLAQMIEATKDIPIVQIATNTLSTNSGWKPSSKITPDMTHPILILDDKIIDGNHRLKYAIDFDIFYVRCKKFTIDNIPKQMHSVFI